MQTIALLAQSPDVELLGVTVVSGDGWRDEEVVHTLRLLEIIGRTDIPVMYGAAFPLLRTREEAKLWQQHYGKVSYAGAWDDRWYHEPFAVPSPPEGSPKIKAAAEDAVHFLIRMVHQYPGEVTIYEGGPMTNLALAQTIDPTFASSARELIFMGGSLNPETTYEEFVENPRHEFNFWFDPEAAQIVLRAEWKKIVCTPTDISIKTRLTPELAKQIGASKTPLGEYVARYFQPEGGNDFMWDELAAAAWLDPTLITKKDSKYMGVDIDHGAGYGNTLTSSANDAANLSKQPVEINVDLDKQRFYDLFQKLMTLERDHKPN